MFSGGVPSEGSTIMQEPTTPLMPGIYELEARHSGMMLDVPNAARTPGCHVWQWPRNGTSAQLWYISHVQDEWYRIRNVGSWLYLDADALMPDGCPVVTNPMNERNPDIQLWKFESMEPGSSTYRITNKAKGLVVDFAYGSLVSNELVILFPWNGNTCQQWTALQVPFLTDEYEVVALHSSRALDVPGQSRVVGTVPCQSDRSRSLGQRWRLVYRGGGDYQIQSMLSNLMLQVSIKPAPGVMLTQDDPEAGDAQLWQIEPVDAAQQSYRFVSKALDMVLQIHAGQHSAGMQLETGSWTGAPHQQWLIYSDND
jgi:Ricin-type beta-trefoil lectin domain-like